MSALPLTGGCLCGAVRFEVSQPPLMATYCHCRRCQRRTGTAASAQARVAPGSVRVVVGAEHVRAYEPPDGFAKLFCSICGSALFSRRLDADDVWSVRMGAFDDDPGVRPAHRQWVSSAAAWEPLPDDGLPRHDGFAPA